ncbi:maleylpyruvate isomerase N-terminal domain-containing protein [Streptomyces sp. NPDC001922]|uniref:maleylpyruvate isomerase N-terminal domain-containing protein n=1 Tax=Streptomyces sp. NPDC001922 TaxID=3364624 RepID=UPI0036836CB4
MSGPFGPGRHDPEDDGRDGGRNGGAGPGPRRFGSAGRPRIPPPRSAPEDNGPLPDPPPAVREDITRVPAPRPPGAPRPLRPPPAPVPVYDHRVLKSLLGAWALAACSAEETAAVEAHLTDCAPCADEAVRLRDAVGLLHKEDNLDLDPLLRSRVLEGCLGRRPARIPVPEWAAPYDAESARLDALLRDMGAAEWRAPVRLRWFEEDHAVEREVTVAAVLGHLMTVDSLVAVALGLPDPLGAAAPAEPSPASRTEAYWRGGLPEQPRSLREPWRDQAHTLIRTVSFAGRGVAELEVPYGDFTLPLRDSFVDRAFECWVHAGDIAEAVDYPYEPPVPGHLNLMIDLAVRILPATLAARRRAGLASPPRTLVAAGAPGRSLHLEVEGSGGGDWHIPLDSPAAVASEDHAVAHVALDGIEFCRLAAGHVPPEQAAAGQEGDREAIRDVLSAVASLSRL